MSFFGKIKSAVMGNPVTREYEVGKQVASAGPGLLWKVHQAVRKSTRQVRRREREAREKWSEGRKGRETKVGDRTIDIHVHVLRTCPALVAMHGAAYMYVCHYIIRLMENVLVHGVMCANV